MTVLSLKHCPLMASGTSLSFYFLMSLAEPALSFFVGVSSSAHPLNVGAPRVLPLTYLFSQSTKSPLVILFMLILQLLFADYLQLRYLF